VAFVGVYLVIAGILNVLWGIAAHADKRGFAEDELIWSNLAFWGTAALIVGIVQLVGAGLVMAQRVGGPVIAGFLAFLGLMLNFVSIGAYPIWSVILLAIDALILWAVTVHSDEFV
jgi:hypothetical protein